MPSFFSKKKVQIKPYVLFYEILLLSYFIFALYGYFDEDPFSSYAGLGLASLAVIFVIKRVNRTEEILLFVGLLFSILLGFNLLFVQDYISSVGLGFIATIPIAIILYRLLSTQPRKIALFFSAYAFFFSLSVIIRVNVFNITPNEILTASRNHIATIGFIAFSLAFLGYKTLNSKTDFWWGVLISGLAVSGTIFLYTGRVGVVLSIVVMLILVIEQIVYRGGSWHSVVFMFIFVLILVLMFFTLADKSIGLESFQEDSLETGRWEIWSSIFNHLRKNRLLVYIFGFKYRLSQELTGLTLHNSFLFIYRDYGLIGFFSIIMIFGFVSIKLILYNFDVGLIMFGFFLRVFFDTVMIGSMGGVLFFLLFLIALNGVRTGKYSNEKGLIT